MGVSERIEKLRNIMKRENIDYYIVPSADFHQSEYVSECFKSRAYITGFTGSAGTALIGMDKAILWTDGRYFIQAEQQLAGSEIELYKMRIPGWPSLEEYLSANMKEGECLGFDGRVFSINEYKEFKKIQQSKNIKIAMDKDLIAEIWADKPSMPKEKVFLHDVKYSGKSVNEKLQEVREQMKTLGCKSYILSSLDDIAWLFNIRGNDVECTPVTLAYALIDDKAAVLYIDKDKISGEDKSILENRDGIILKNYEDIFEDVKLIKENVLLDPSKVSAFILTKLNEDVRVIESINITTNLKAIKNNVEIECFKNSHIKDGVAMVRFTKWLKENVGKEKITELTLSDKLVEFRSMGDLFIEESFKTIAGYKEHAAMMHYSATEESAYELKKEGMVLVDCGGQYLDGTTDITRTFVLGKITEEEKKDFTLVLKGHINLMTCKFLQGSIGSSLDIMARKPLWEEGIDYKCGTGHGIGFCLSVHEGPQQIRPINYVELKPGMILTNEPGVYKEGKHGIRIENVMLIVEDSKTEYGGQFYKFEPLSYSPIDLEGIEVSMLTDKEREWINNYHKETYDKLSPYLNDEEKEFLRKETRAI